MTTLLRAVAATIVAAAWGVVLPLAHPSPAAAAPCPGASGVAVVVDFHGLGGGAQQGCAPTAGGQSASSAFRAAGFDLTRVRSQQSFVCRVSGAPAGDPCVNTPPADAYWALYWSDGESGSWTYATTGVDSLKVPDGGYVAFSWHGSPAQSLPGVTPSARTQPSPSASATVSPGSDQGPSDVGPEDRDSSGAGSDPASESAGTDDRGGVPGWLTALVLVLVAAAAAGTTVVRRRRTPGADGP